MHSNEIWFVADKLEVSDVNSPLIWVDSSWKGTNMIAYSYYPFIFCFFCFLSLGWCFLAFRISWQIGIRYERVLPVPVGAVTSTLRPSSRAGRACICTGVGFLSPILPSPSISPSCRWYLLINLVKLFITKGISNPSAFIPNSFLNRWDFYTCFWCWACSISSLTFLFLFWLNSSISSSSDSLNFPFSR